MIDVKPINTILLILDNNPDDSPGESPHNLYILTSKTSALEATDSNTESKTTTSTPKASRQQKDELISFKFLFQVKFKISQSNMASSSSASRSLPLEVWLAASLSSEVKPSISGVSRVHLASLMGPVTLA